MRPKISFITVPVENIERSRHFYQQAFDFPVAEENETLCLFELEDGFYFVIQKNSDFSQTEHVIPPNGGFILSHNAESPKEVDEIVERALRFGAVKKKVLMEDWGYSVTLKDPDGHHWEIVFNTQS